MAESPQARLNRIRRKAELRVFRRLSGACIYCGKISLEFTVV